MTDSQMTVSKGGRILCVDDEEEVRALLARLVQRAGYVCEAAADGREALKKISANMDDYGMVITDHNMPCMGGIALVKALRAASFPGRIVVFSSPLDAPAHTAYEEMRVDAIIEKPAQVDMLLQTLTKLFRSVTPPSKCNN
jgi:CheY-like chemotaxis protein